jgi:hypothetical protein
VRLRGGWVRLRSARQRGDRAPLATLGRGLAPEPRIEAVSDAEFIAYASWQSKVVDTIIRLMQVVIF